ncbi:MAG: hypothetical protein RJA61_636 [Candidatus Parcubacteria bacterium]|jgi:hypothetical protein
MNEGRYNTLITIVILLLVIGFFAYSFFFVEPDPALSTGLVTESTNITQEISTLLTTLEPISLSQGVFTNPLFTGLSDFGLSIIPFPSGRTNPFAPLGL